MPEERPETIECIRCGRAFVRQGSRGPLPIYCSGTCRQRAYEARHGLPVPWARPIDASDERLVATFIDWWTNHPVPEIDDERMAAIEDVRSLVGALTEAGYSIFAYVPPNGRADA